MIYGYARVSTQGQAKDGNSLEAQEAALKNAGAEKIYRDVYTGTKLSRPAFDELVSVLKPKDMLVVTKLDRFCRTAAQGMELVDALLARGVRIRILNMGLLDDTPAGKMMRNVMLCFAEFERDMIVQRTQEGKSIAKQDPEYREGRRPVYGQHQIRHALELLDTHTYAQVSAMTGISKSTLIRAKRKEQKP